MIWDDLSINQNYSLITDDLQLAKLFNNYFSKICSELRQQIPINVRYPISFFDDTDKKYSAFRFYELTPDEVGMAFSIFPNKGSPLDKIPTLIFE